MCWVVLGQQWCRASGYAFGKADSDPCAVGKEFFFFFLMRDCRPPAWARSRVSCAAVRCFPPAGWVFFSLLKYASPEVPPAGRRGWAVPWGEAVGTSWNRPSPAWAGPGLSSQRGLRLTARYRYIFRETLQAPWTCELSFFKREERGFFIPVTCPVMKACAGFHRGRVNLGFYPMFACGAPFLGPQEGEVAAVR